MLTVFTNTEIKEWINELVANYPEYWKKHIRRYPDGNDVIVEYFGVMRHPSTVKLEIMNSEALEILQQIMERREMPLSCDIEAHIVTAKPFCLDITFGWTE